MARKTVESIKGFDPNFSCRGFSFEVGKTYTVKGTVKSCENGFHACPDNPFDVWGYYNPVSDKGLTRYAIVDQSGDMDREDNKIASASITIKAELSLPEFIGRGVECILSKIDWKDAKELSSGTRSASTNTGHGSASTNTGTGSASTNTGDYSASTNTGDYSASTNTGTGSASTNTGDYSASTNTGHGSASTNTGTGSASTNTGDYSASTNTGDYSASTNTGTRSASTNTGHGSASTNTGDYSVSIVENAASLAIASGHEGKAKAAEGSGIVLVYRAERNGPIVHLFSSMIGQNGIKADTWYKLNAAGEPVECEVVSA